MKNKLKSKLQSKKSSPAYIHKSEKHPIMGVDFYDKKDRLIGHRDLGEGQGSKELNKFRERLKKAGHKGIRQTPPMPSPGHLYYKQMMKGHEPPGGGGHGGNPNHDEKGRFASG